MRTIVFGGLHWGPLVLGNYQIPELQNHKPLNPAPSRGSELLAALMRAVIDSSEKRLSHWARIFGVQQGTL